MEHNLFSHVDIDPARTHVPDGACPDAAAACAAYEQSIAEAGGLGLQLLGLGHNGHIGFNEPAPEFPKETHCVELTESTINANSRLFDSIDDVPREAYTMGIGTIMAAKEILVVANGSDKADIVRRAFFGPVTPEVPASILQFHPNVTVVVDKEAGALCQFSADRVAPLLHVAALSRCKMRGVLHWPSRSARRALRGKATAADWMVAAGGDLVALPYIAHSGDAAAGRRSLRCLYCGARCAFGAASYRDDGPSGRWMKRETQ